MSGYNADDMLQKRIDQTNSCSYLFYKYDGDNVDFIAGLDTSNVTDMSEMFNSCRKLEKVPRLDAKNATNMSGMFYDCGSITQIKIINIGANLEISHCIEMEREALLEVLGNLKDLTGSTGATLTLGSTLLAKLTEDDIAIATNKNWTVA